MAVVTSRQRHVVAACYLGWTLDAFDYFIMALTLDDVARSFHTSRTALSFAFQLTLAMRPVGAFAFGRLADRFGRRPALMASVLLYSIFEFGSGIAPGLTSFLLLRALFGVAMGGEWGVGASLTMESIPIHWRGRVSGLLQAGYPTGFLLASVVNWAFSASIGWRGLFMLGALPALLVLYIRSSVPESSDWVAQKTARQSVRFMDVLRRNASLTIYVIGLMTAFNFFSHGTQDLYKTFLTHERHLPLGKATTILVLMNVAAIVGGIGCASLSQRIGRRAAIAGAAVVSLLVLPFWAFSKDPVAIGIAAFGMQLCVQGAWGVIPVHLNELSPPDIRATFPGLTYTLGNLLASFNAPLQSGLADRYFAGDLSYSLAIVVGLVAVIITTLVIFGREDRKIEMGGDERL